MKVYVVVNGEKNEGGAVTGVYFAYESARSAALATGTCFKGGWREDTLNKDYWENGCDYVLVKEFEVQ